MNYPGLTNLHSQPANLSHTVFEELPRLVLTLFSQIVSNVVNKELILLLYFQFLCGCLCDATLTADALKNCVEFHRKRVLLVFRNSRASLTAVKDFIWYQALTVKQITDQECFGVNVVMCMLALLFFYIVRFFLAACQV